MFCEFCPDQMPGKGYADYRPGTPLADTLVIFTLPIVRGQPAGDPLLQHFLPKSLSHLFSGFGGNASSAAVKIRLSFD